MNLDLLAEAQAQDNSAWFNTRMVKLDRVATDEELEPITRLWPDKNSPADDWMFIDAMLKDLEAKYEVEVPECTGTREKKAILDQLGMWSTKALRRVVILQITANTFEEELVECQK